MAQTFACPRKEKGVTCADCDHALDTQACTDNARAQLAAYQRQFGALSKEVGRYRQIEQAAVDLLLSLETGSGNDAALTAMTPAAFAALRRLAALLAVPDPTEAP